MPWLVRAQVRPLLGSVALHVVFLLVIGIAAVRWRADPPPAQLAIEGNVVRYEDLPRSVRTGKPLRDPVAPEVTQPAPQPPAPQPEPEIPQPEVSAESADTASAAAEAERKAIESQRAADALRREQAAREGAAADAAAAAERRAEEDARRKAAALAQEEAAAEARAKQEAQAAAARDAKMKSQREAELRRALATEEEGEALAQSGVMDEYRALLIQTIERNWIRPPSARAGLECTLYVNQATGGTVIDVQIGDCNGDQAVRESVANAVYRSSPLPAPRDPRAFERRLVIVFKPTE